VKLPNIQQRVSTTLRMYDLGTPTVCCYLFGTVRNGWWHLNGSSKMRERSERQSRSQVNMLVNPQRLSHFYRGFAIRLKARIQSTTTTKDEVTLLKGGEAGLG
jgi:hypothetical protein